MGILGLAEYVVPEECVLSSWQVEPEAAVKGSRAETKRKAKDAARALRNIVTVMN